jgi:protein-S-isoprenylcysteine O-methyltransferase Ste14
VSRAGFRTSRLNLLLEEQLMTVFKSLLYLFLEAGLFALYIPLVLLRTGPKIETGVFSVLAIPLWLFGGWIILRCFWDFTLQGRGTPLPADPPKELVISGFYHYVRNPIYVGVLLIFLGHFLWFGYWALLIYAIASFVGVHVFVVFYEEPNLRRKFGSTYEDYLRRVPRWIPRFTKG